MLSGLHSYTRLARISHYAGADPGLALIRDGNATRSIDTLLRYRNAAVAELTRTLRTLQALQAAPRANAGPAGASRAAARVARRAAPDEPARGAAHRLDGIVPDPPDPAATLHEPAVPPRRADQTETGPGRGAGAIGATVPNEPERRGNPGRSARATHARATPGGAPRSGAPGLAVGPAPAAGAAHAGAPAPRARIEPAARQDGVAAPPGRPPAARRRCAEPAG